MRAARNMLLPEGEIEALFDRAEHGLRRLHDFDADAFARHHREMEGV